MALFGLVVVLGEAGTEADASVKASSRNLACGAAPELLLTGVLLPLADGRGTSLMLVYCCCLGCFGRDTLIWTVAKLKITKELVKGLQNSSDNQQVRAKAGLYVVKVIILGRGPLEGWRSREHVTFPTSVAIESNAEFIVHCEGWRARRRWFPRTCA